MLSRIINTSTLKVKWSLTWAIVCLLLAQTFRPPLFASPNPEACSLSGELSGLVGSRQGQVVSEYASARGILVPEESLLGVQSALRRIGVDLPVEQIRGERFISFINRAAQQIASARGDALAHGQSMADFANALQPSIERLPDAQKRRIESLLGLAVMRLERWTPSEYQQVTTFHPMVAGSHVHPQDYPVWVESYLNNNGLYASASGPGLISATDIRDMESQNLWPVYMKPHDMTHIHHALGHPDVVGMVFTAARSRNNLRYVMMGALWEGIDTVQYSQERAIARYFDQTMHMDMEQAMAHLAGATDAELERIANATGEGSTFRSGARDFRDWRPRTGGAFDSRGRTRVGLDVEVDAMLENLNHAIETATPAYRRMLNYRRDAVGSGGNDTNDAQLQYEGRPDVQPTGTPPPPATTRSGVWRRIRNWFRSH